MHSTNADGIVGAFSSKTSDDAQKVVDHFKELFENQGYKIGSVSMTKTGDRSFRRHHRRFGRPRALDQRRDHRELRRKPGHDQLQREEAVTEWPGA